MTATVPPTKPPAGPPPRPKRAPSLTDADRRIITQARSLAAVRLIDGLREHTGEADPMSAFIDGFAEARHLLTELVAIIERQATEAAATRPR